MLVARCYCKHCVPRIGSSLLNCWEYFAFKIDAFRNVHVVMVRGKNGFLYYSMLTPMRFSL